VTQATYIAGVDPGLSGAIALYRPAPLDVQVFDMPTFAITTNGKKKRDLDLMSLARWMDVNGTSIRLAMVEDVHAMPGQGVSSCFKFGFAAGVAQMALASCFVPVRRVRPNQWKQAMRLSADKDASRRLASELLPTFSHLWSRVMNDGRAEAVLLAVYGHRIDMAERSQAA
jgi:crossover junction endodeoxyribonuclease RuvC